jgi:hypothetical protein
MCPDGTAYDGSELCQTSKCSVQECCDGTATLGRGDGDGDGDAEKSDDGGGVNVFLVLGLVGGGALLLCCAVAVACVTASNQQKSILMQSQTRLTNERGMRDERAGIQAAGASRLDFSDYDTGVSFQYGGGPSDDMSTSSHQSLAPLPVKATQHWKANPSIGFNDFKCANRSEYAAPKVFGI